MNPTVYILFFTDTPYFYIGSTTNFKRRLSYHLSQLKWNRHDNVNFQRVWNELSVDKSIRYSTIEFDDIKSANEFELQLIEACRDDRYMLNIGLSLRAGDLLTINPNREDILRRRSITRLSNWEKLSVSERIAIRDMRGEKNPMYGRTHSEKARKAIAIKRTGMKFPGRKLSSDHIQKISDRMKKKVGSLNPFYGRKHSAETKKFLSEKFKGCKTNNGNKISIDGVIYNSQSDAAKALGISDALMTYRLKRIHKYPGYKLITR